MNCPKNPPSKLLERAGWEHWIAVFQMLMAAMGCGPGAGETPRSGSAPELAWEEPDRIPVYEAPAGSGPGGDSASGTLPDRALIYIGASTWGAETASIEETLRQHRISYQEATAPELNTWSDAELSRFDLLIIPGGYAPGLTSELSLQSRERLRARVRTGAMGYLGFCAGAWLAISPPEPDSFSRYYGIGFIDGPILPETQMARAGQSVALVAAALWDGSTRALLWWGGPVTPEAAVASDRVIARYPDGSPAISSLVAGSGRVVIAGLHPTATRGVLLSLGMDSPESIAPDLTWMLVQEAGKAPGAPSGAVGFRSHRW